MIPKFIMTLWYSNRSGPWESTDETPKWIHMRLFSDLDVVVFPGLFLAHVTVYLSIARSFALFNVYKACEYGKEVEVKPEFQAGVNSHPVPRTFNVTPRSPSQEALILSVEKEYPLEESDAPDLKNVSNNPF